MKKIALLFLLGLLSGWAHGTTRYVTTTGSDSNPCTLASPCLTPAHAFNSVAAPGDTVQVAAGTYTYSSNVKFTNSGTAGNSITLACVTRGACKIQTNNTGVNETVIWAAGNYETFDGFEVTNSNAAVPNVDLGFYISGDHINITHNKIHGIFSNCSGGGGINKAGGAGSGDVYDSNLVYDIGAPSCGSFNHTHGINFEPNSPATVTITNNIVYNTHGGWGIQFTGTAVGTTGSTVSNNLLFSNGNGGIIFALNGGSGTMDYLTVTNNTIFDNGTDQPKYGIYEYNDGPYGTHNVYQNNDLFGNAGGNYQFNNGSQTGGISVDPSIGTTFVNWQANGSGDYHEKAGSPTIAAGTANGAPNHDFDGNPRPSGAGFDMGAYQIAGITWFIRPDGGTRYSSNVTTGQCNGKFDVAYPGSGTNQNCAFNDFRYLWDDDSGAVGAGTWVIAGGDTIVNRGCTASANQVNPANPTCRIGWDNGNGGGPTNLWCQFVGNNICFNPPVPAGTSGAHTRILSGYAYDHPGATVPRVNTAQIFGGFGLTWTFNLKGANYLDIVGIELTTHNGACSHHGSPQYPASCSTSPPISDFADNGFLTDNTTKNLLLQDVYVDGFESAGLNGPIGGVITMNRVNVSFNAAAGWNFDDGSDTADASGSQILASYVTMIGNGCKQQYPLVNSFPALACWDSVSNGFGDAWSGQDTVLDVFTCDHCTMMYNTKDAYIGPHTQITANTITNSVSIGNMGAQWKWGANLSSTVLFQNNLTVGNCFRMTTQLPGASQTFNQASGLPGAYLTNFCRAGGAAYANLTRLGSVNHYYGNTVIGASTIIFQQNCGYYSPGNVFHQETNCGSVPTLYQDNNFLGYNDPSNGDFPALYFAETPSIIFVGAFNNEFGIKGGTGDTCGVNNITCNDPKQQSQPAQPWPGSEAALDVYNPFGGAGNSFYLSSLSTLPGTGTTLGGLTTDYYGTTRPSPPTPGGVEGTATTPTVATPTASPAGGTYATTQSVTLLDSTSGASICYTIDGSIPTAVVAGTCDGLTYSTPLSVAATTTIHAIGTKAANLNSSVASFVYTITPIVPTTTVSGKIVISGTVQF